MAESGPFDWLCGALERVTSLSRLEARGTIRLALRSAGLDARSVTTEQLGVVVKKVLPQELVARGIAGDASICEQLCAGLVAAGIDAQDTVESPESIFQRLAPR